MLKKWKRILKLIATTTILLAYVVLELYNGETLKGGENEEFQTDRFPPTVKTIVSYSRDYLARKELSEGIECEALAEPEADAGTGSAWKQNERLGVRVYSAYYDDRLKPYHYVRMIGLVSRNFSFYCQLRYEGNETVTQKAVIREIWSPGWGAKGSTCDDEYPAVISCSAPHRDASPPSWVTFVDGDCHGDGVFTRIHRPNGSEPKDNFVVCVKPLHFTNTNERTLREWVEINERLGAGKIFVYLTDWKSPGLESRILVREQFVTAPAKCSTGNPEESVWFRRKMEIIAYNDCFYRNLYRARFVIPLDVDEIIVPKIGNNWLEAFESHFSTSPSGKATAWPDTYASFSVRNAYFFSRYPRTAVVRTLGSNKSETVPKKLVKSLFAGEVPQKGSSIFDRTVRSYYLSPNTDSVKSFVSVPATLSVFNHFAFHVLDGASQQYVFPQHVFQLNHYRNSCDPVLIDGCSGFLNHVTYDDSLEKFRNPPKSF